MAMSAIYDVIITFSYAVLAILLKLSVALYSQRSSLMWRFLLGCTQYLLCSCLSILMMFYIYFIIPESFGFLAAVFSCLIGTIAIIFVHLLNLMGETKRRLSEQQKAELMDL